MGWTGLFTDSELRATMADWLETSTWLDFPVSRNPHLPRKTSLIVARSVTGAVTMTSMVRAQKKKPGPKPWTTGETVAAVGVTGGLVALVTKLLKVW